MAGVIGSGSGGYATIDPLAQNHVGAAMAQVDDLALKNRALMEDRLAKQAAERLARQKMRQDQLDKDEAELNKTKVNATGYNTIDGPVNETLYKWKRGFNEASQALLNSSLSPEDENRYRDQKSMYLQNIQRVASSMDKLNEANKFLTEHGKDMDPDDFKAAKDRLEKLATGQYSIDVDGGNQYITTKDINGNDVKMDADKYFDLRNPHGISKVGEILQERINNWDATPYASDNGTIRTKGTQWTDRDDKEAELFVGSLLTNEDDRYRIAKNYGLRTDDLKGMKSKIVEEIKNGVKLEKEITNTEDKALNYRIRQDREKKAEAAPVGTTLSGIKLLDDYHRNEKGVIVPKERSKKGIYENGISFPKGLPYKNAGGKQGLNNLSINSVFINDKGDIIYTADVLDSKGESSKTVIGEDGNYTTTTEAGKYGKTTLKASPTAEAAIARAYGLNSTEALKAALREMNKDQIKDGKTASGKQKAADSGFSKSQKAEKITRGQVVDGYKFLGGDPNSASSWKKI